MRPDFIRPSVSLKPFNTFRFDYSAEYLAIVDSVEMLVDALKWAGRQSLAVTVLGGGSNLLIQSDLSGLIIINQVKGRSTVKDNEDYVWIECAAGEVWHDCVKWSVDNHWFGIENLALIPGTVGAAPVQNIGAYGVEIKDVLDSLYAIDIETQQIHSFSKEDCHFAYRESRFKQEWAGKFIILSVVLKLSKISSLVLEYGGIKSLLPDFPTQADVFEIVCRVRREKLPDPQEIPNSGSFFKNPVVSAAHYESLKQRFPNIVAFNQGDDWKLAAGWLNDQAGWKGVKKNGVGVYEHQALVLVNYSCDKADQLLSLQNEIQDSVKDLFGVYLEREPVLLGDRA